MAWALPFLAILSCFSVVISQVTLIQPASQSASPGETTKLSCTHTSSLGSIGWYQQRHGQAPRYVHRYGIDRREGIPDRFTASVSGNGGYLTITDIQPEDEAVYYCGGWFGSTAGYIFGSGTQLNILGQPTVAPRVNAYPPSPEELGSSDNATLVCLLDGFYPGTVHVSWEGDDTPISSGVETTTPTKLNDKYMASSYLNMRKSDWESYETVTCKVTHEGKTIEKVVRR